MKSRKEEAPLLTRSPQDLGTRPKKRFRLFRTGAASYLFFILRRITWEGSKTTKTEEKNLLI
jgi:hypothetical protein